MAQQLTNQTIRQLQAAYAKAPSRLFLLDYDGTLVGFKPTPQAAVPTRAALGVVQKLAADPANTVVIVSGRDKQTMGKWFGDLAVDVSAEHGHFTRRRGGEWQAAAPTSQAWKRAIRPLFAAAVQKVPRSLIEEKQTALCWHYRQAAAPDVQTVLPTLLQQLAAHDCHVLSGNRVVEVRGSATTKALALQQWFKGQPFVCIAGDDTTDEAMFAAAPKNAATVKVRPGDTKAAYIVPSHRELIAFLRNLVQ